MPQLANESFVTQYFWLVIFLGLFHYVVVSEVIPNIALTLKARKFQATSASNEEASADEGVTAMFDTVRNITNDNITTEASSAGTTIEAGLKIEQINTASIKTLKV